jgi:hypothetical protein
MLAKFKHTTGGTLFINPIHVVMLMEAGIQLNSVRSTELHETDVYLSPSAEDDANIVRVVGFIDEVAALLGK